MKTFTLKNKFQTNATLVANDFIEHYMVQANGEFVKVYLFLLRHLDNAGSSLTVSAVADCLNNTENDILRAFKYWESKGLLQMECDAEGHVCELELIQIPQTQAQIPITAAKKPSAPVVSVKPAAPKAVAASVSRPAAHADAAKAQKQLKSLLFIAEQYLGKTLTKTDMDAITYFYDHLGMSADLIEYLIEYCVSKGSASRHYMRTVALGWAEAGVSTVLQAKQEANTHNKNFFAVMNTFGIKGRGPAVPEQEIMSRWFNDFQFSPDIVLEACRRTIRQTHQPNFQYADKILEHWHSNKVRSLSDIAALDRRYKSAQEKPAPKPQKASGNRFNNFSQREYDYNQLEKQLLNQ